VDGSWFAALIRCSCLKFKILINMMWINKAKNVYFCRKCSFFYIIIVNFKKTTLIFNKFSYNSKIYVKDVNVYAF
jgi:hypothetical protein